MSETVKKIQILVDVNPDGIYGKKTNAAILDAIRQGITFDGYKAPILPQSVLRSNASIYGVFGDENNIVSVKIPEDYPLCYEGIRLKTIRIHRLLEDRMEAILKDTIAEYGENIAEMAPGLCNYSGSFNARKTTGGGAYSIHGYGAAIDMDAEYNTYSMSHTRARLARSEYETFWSIVREHGGYPLGKRSDCDWMHYQFASWE